MRPVDPKFEISQAFAGMATQGVAPNDDPSTVGYYVKLYGNYQPFGHAGCDFACPIGTPVYAMSAGTVIYAGWSDDLPGDESDWGYRQRWYLYRSFPGIVTVIQHSWGIGIYAHLSDNDVAPKGTRVKEGQLIGFSGNTSSRTGRLAAHLHVEALVDDSFVTARGLIYGRTNPTKYFGNTAPDTETVVANILDLKVQEYKEDGIAKGGIKTLGFIIGNLNQWVGRILAGQKLILSEVRGLRADVAAIKKAVIK